MNWEVKTVEAFDKEAKRLSKKYKSLPQDLSEFLKEIKKNPFCGTEICPGVRKIRIAIKSKGKGKSGGARIISYVTYIDPQNGKIYLLYIYDKGEASNIRNEFLIDLLKDLI